MQHMELFKNLQENNIWDAQIVGKNLFCKNPADAYILSEYFDFCIKVANYPIDIETRNFFINEAELCLTIFTEKANIDETNLDWLDDYLFGDGICLIEWAENITSILPDGYIKIDITKNPDSGSDYREITIC